jgi:hypothetical protein
VSLLFFLSLRLPCVHGEESAKDVSKNKFAVYLSEISIENQLTTIFFLMLLLMLCHFVVDCPSVSAPDSLNHFVFISLLHSAEL